MSMTKAAVLATTTSSMSLIVGLYAGFYLTNKRVTDQYELILEEQVSQAKAFYSQRNKTGDYADPVALAEKLVADDEEKVIDDNDPIASDPAEMFETQIDPQDRANYNEISKEYTGPAVVRETYSRSSLQPHPNESMEEFETRVAKEAQALVATVIDRSGETNLHEVTEEVNEVGEPEVRNIFDTNKVESLEHEMKRTRDVTRPYIVTSEEFEENILDHMQTTITYYRGDNTIADEMEKPVDDLEGVVGTQNLQFGNGSSDPNVVYVRNEEMQMDFEVCLDEGSFAEEVLGAPPARPQTRPI